MGQPQSEGRTYQGHPGHVMETATPDSITGVIGMTSNHLNEIEKRLNTLLDRIVPSPHPPEGTAKEAVGGVLNAANIARNTASRIIDVVSQLENAV